MKNGKINRREALFCREYVYSGSAKEAAERAGYNILPEICGIKLLTDKNVKNEIARLEKNLSATRAEALRGYRRLAFGSIADAARLLTEDKIENIDDLDLFMVSEIKKPKGGGLEIKFFDRQKALERIEKLSEDTENGGAAAFYRALQNTQEELNEG